MAFTLPGVPSSSQILTPEQMGVPDLTSALAKGIQLGYMPREKQAALQKSLLDNIHQQLVNQFTPEDYKSTFASRYASAGNQNAEARLNNLKYNNPGLLGSPTMVDATVAEMIKAKGGQAAVDAHDQIRQAYPDAPLEQTVPLALQLSQSQPKESYTPIAGNSLIDNVANTLMQKQGQQASQQPLNNMTPLTQSLNNTLMPQQQAQQVPEQNQDLRLRAVNAEIAKEEANANYLNQGGARVGTGGKGLNDISRTIGQEHPDWSPEQIIDARNQYMTGSTTFSDGSPLPPITPDISAAISASYKTQTDVNQRQQQRFAATLADLTTKADVNAPSAFKFAGAAGAANKTIEALGLQVGKNDPDYMSYRKFVDQDIPSMVTEVVRTTGAHSTNAQKAQYLAQLITTNINSNPELAKEEWNEFKDLFNGIRTTINKPAYLLANAGNQNSSSGQSQNSNAAPTKVTFIRDANGKLVKA